MPPPESTLRTRSLASGTLIWFTLILALKWSTLSEPPVWDAVFGLFPAAGELADNGFDLPALLQKPTCRMGGPNTHSESLVTWVSAGVLRLLGKGPQAFAVLHLLHFGMAAWTLAVLQRFTSQLWGRAMGWIFCGTLLMCPLFRVQVGALYFEIPLTACTLAAVMAFANGQLGRSVVWSTLAVLVKQAGLVVAGALTVAAFCQPGSLKQRFGRSISFAVSGLTAAFWPLVSTAVLDGVKNSSPFGNWWQYMSDYHLRYLAAVPDLTVAFGLVAIVGVIRLKETWHSLVKEPAKIGTPPCVLGVSFLLVAMYAMFFFVTPYFARLTVFCLPRYFVFILPFIFFSLTYWLIKLSSLRLAAIVLAGVAVLFVGNREGNWYPKEARDEISVLERGESYRWVVAVQREAAQTAANLPDDAVIYYGFEDHFFQKYPWLGYANRTHPGGRALSLPDERPKSLEMVDFPERFFVILANPLLFGHRARSILRSASLDPLREVQLFRRCQRGPHRIDIWVVSTVNPPSKIEAAE